MDELDRRLVAHMKLPVDEQVKFIREHANLFTIMFFTHLTMATHDIPNDVKDIHAIHVKRIVRTMETPIPESREYLMEYIKREGWDMPVVALEYAAIHGETDYIRAYVNSVQHSCDNVIVSIIMTVAAERNETVMKELFDMLSEGGQTALTFASEIFSRGL